MWYFVGILASVVMLYNCSGGQFGTDKIFGPPEVLPIERYEDMTVDVIFSYPNGDVDNLGTTVGTSSCRAKAFSHAGYLGMIENNEWGYVCCTHEDNSTCYRKIR